LIDQKQEDAPDAKRCASLATDAAVTGHES